MDKTSKKKGFNFFELKLNGTISVQCNKSNKKIFWSRGLYCKDSIFSRSKLFYDTLYIFDFNNNAKIKKENSKDNFLKIKMPRIRYNQCSLIIRNKIYFIGGKN